MAQSLWDLSGAVREVKPNASTTLVQNLINKHIQSIIKKRSWSDCLKLGAVYFPNQTSSGLIDCIPGSNVFNCSIGSVTAWPVNDAANYTFGKPVTDAPGVVRITPSSMVNINQGDYLLLDYGQTTQEVVIVSWAGSTSFKAHCRFNHAVSQGTIWKSSLSGQQLSLSNNQITTVTAVFNASQLQTDQQFYGPQTLGSAYYISLRYFRISATAYRLLDAVDTVAGDVIGVQKTQQWLNYHDPQRTTQGPNLLEFVSMPANLGGAMQWEGWPAQTSVYGAAVLYVDGWPKLVQPEDLSPYFINEEIFIALAQGDALRTRTIASGSSKPDPYYDLNAASVFTQQGLALLEEAIQQDEGRYLTCLTSYQDNLRGALGNTAYDSDHLPDGQWP